MVYVDDMEAPYGRMIMCHMYADTHDELITMANSIGIPLKWIQYPETYKEHFDICKSKKLRAVKLGAKEVEWRHWGEFNEKHKQRSSK